MSGIDVTIELPEDETPGELIKAYFTMMRAFGWDLYVTSHFKLKKDLGPQWFAERISSLKQSDPNNWRPNHRFEPQDPGVILRDYVHEQDSPYLNTFGGQISKQAAAKKILATRNTWFHFGDDPTASQLEEAAKVVRGFVHSSGMHIAARIDNLIQRLNDLRSGRYPMVEIPVPSNAEEEIALDVPADLARPSIGGTWVGPIPDLRYRMTRAGDVVHPDTMESVRSRVADNFAEKVRAWTAVEPRGRELWIDADGAVGGFIGATPRLLGYLGTDPEGDIARGFFMPNFYVVEGEEVVDLDSSSRVVVPVVTSLDDGTILRITTYGDVISTDHEGGVERIATINPAECFPGQKSRK